MLNRFFSNNKTLIFHFRIPECIELFLKDCCKYNYHIANSSDIEGICRFYKKLHRVEYDTIEKVKKEIQRGSVFHCLIDENTIIAGIWLHQGLVDIKAPSFFAFKDSVNQKVRFEKGTVYSSHNAVANSYIGKHLYTSLLHRVFCHLLENDITDYYLCTGFDNCKMINSSQKYGGKIIGIVETIHVLMYRRKKIYYLNLNEKKWVCDKGSEK